VTDRREVFDQAIAPVMADIERQHPGLLRVVPEPESSELDAWLFESDGGGTGLCLDNDGSGHTADVLSMTAQVQEVAIEAVWGMTGHAAWPECPTHPDRSPLDVNAHGDRVYWFCPHDGHVVSEVGRLGLSPEQEDFDFAFPVQDPLAGPRMTEAEAEDLAAEMRRTGAPDARIGRNGLRNVVDFSDGSGGVLSVMDRDGWVHLRELLARRPAQPRARQGDVVGGIIAWVPPQGDPD
jgi:hypothetical protein